MALAGCRVKKPVSKQQLREALEQATAQFLQGGGEVTNVPQGTSGREPSASPPALSRPLFIEPRGERTLVPEVVAAIEARREALRKPQSRRKTPARKRPRKKTIYDDFGEPLRQVWVDE